MINLIDFEITNETRAAYLRASTYARSKQNEIAHQGQTQNLVWTIIYIVAEAFWSDRTVFVTDVCHGITSPKSSTIKAINRLVRDKVLDRKRDKTDRRRKTLTLSKTFTPKLRSYIDEVISRFMLGNIILQIGDNTKFSPREAESLLVSLRKAKVPIMIHAEDGEILMISEEWERLTGYKHSDIPNIKKWTEKAYGKSGTVREVRNLISTLYKIEGEHFDGAGPVYTKSGKAMEWEFRSAPLGKLQDGRSNIITIARDITVTS